MIILKITIISEKIVVKKTHANVTANVTSTVTTADTYTDNVVKSLNYIKNNIDSNNQIIIHNINIHNNDKTIFFKYYFLLSKLTSINYITVDINTSCLLSIVQLSCIKLKVCYQILTDYVDYGTYKIHSLENLLIKYHLKDIR